MPMSGNLVRGGGMMGLGRVNEREQGGRVYVFDSKRKKAEFCPPVLCTTFSFDPPSLLPPTITPPHPCSTLAH